MTYNKDEDYCTFSPDRLFGVTFNHACYLHDRQYRNEVKESKTRAKADLDLRDHIFKLYKNSNKLVIGFVISRIYYYAVRIGAKKLWVIREVD